MWSARRRGALLAVTVVLQLNAIQFFLATYLGVTGLLLGSLVVGAVIGAVGRGGHRLRATGDGVVGSGGWCPRGALLLFLPSVGFLLLREGFAERLKRRFTASSMWDPQTYFFDSIPTSLQAPEVALIAAGAVLSSVLGAVVPALRASAEDPVEALRAE